MTKTQQIPTIPSNIAAILVDTEDLHIDYEWERDDTRGLVVLNRRAWTKSYRKDKRMVIWEAEVAAFPIGNVPGMMMDLGQAITASNSQDA